MFMRFTTKSTRSVSFITTSWPFGFGCSLDCLRVSILTGSTGSAIGSTTVYAIILACALALYSASVLGAITSRGVVSVFRSGKDGSLGITASCGITAFVSIKHNQYAREIRQFPCSVSIYFKVCGSFKLSRISASCSNVCTMPCSSSCGEWIVCIIDWLFCITRITHSLWLAYVKHKIVE